MKKITLALAVLGTALVPALYTAPAHAQATRTWVSGVGDDANPCSRTAPCKTFAGAISKTANGGEINCLDPGGFGPLTITKSITVQCGPAMGHSFVFVAGTDGITVSRAAAPPVALRRLPFEAIFDAAANSSLNHVRFTGVTPTAQEASNDSARQPAIDFCPPGGHTSTLNLSDEALVFGKVKGEINTRPSISVRV